MVLPLPRPSPCMKGFLGQRKKWSDVERMAWYNEASGHYPNAPAGGAKVLFFSGGSALHDACSELTRHTHRSMHVITPFDSGGSSAELRKAFAMPAVGDLRNRLLALADTTCPAVSALLPLLEYRLERDVPLELLREVFQSMLQGRHPLLQPVPEAIRQNVRSHLTVVADRMPQWFDLRGASIGNLALAGAYLSNGRRLNRVLATYSHWLRVRGIVLPVTEQCRHLAVRLADGTCVVGQHRITGKETPPLKQPITDLWLVNGPTLGPVSEASACDEALRCIEQADLVCYSFGSFHSSLAANLLVSGVGKALARNPCPKVFVPNTLPDSESLGLDVVQQVERLVAILRRDAGRQVRVTQLVDTVLIDSSEKNYPNGVGAGSMRRMGLDVVPCPLVEDAARGQIDPERFVRMLLSRL
ncbi:CofD-related protein, GAK system [Paucidesulfovibrio gracilis DSM 16080]|uniref:CofD-related protein, GAK system n=2 Tax=Paucidesulfovibrio TaxID=2910985 RepID=A0A1T4WNA4_9BACT|nr:CofD-related protein, GAK system [Paucidesulfovibrio gracilis DSM 16080]